MAQRIGPARECGQKRRRWKRTPNMPYMSVTLEVSKLSGWLKASASCRVQRGHPTEGRRVWHGDVAQREGRISSARGVRACVAEPSGVWGQKAQAEAHLEHVAHGCDAGGVKAQRLVESIRILPSPKRGIRQRDDACGTRRCGTERRANQQRIRRACVAQFGSVGAEGAGGSAQRT